MVKFIEWLKQWLWIAFVSGLFIFWLYVVRGWTGTDWLTAQTGDTLTAEKWNALNAKVDSISASNWWWEEVSLTGTEDFDVLCDRKFQHTWGRVWNSVNQTNSELRFMLSWPNRLYVSSTLKSLMKLQNTTDTWVVVKLWKRCN